MFAESRQMGSSLSRVLSVDKRIIFLSILIGMGQDYLDVIPLEMNYRIQGVGGHILAEQIEQTMT